MAIRRSPESMVYEQFAMYLAYQHKALRAYTHFDTGGVNNPSPASRALYSRLNPYRGWPDFFLAYPIIYPHTIVPGLFLEIKAEGTRLKKRDGSWASDHIAEQADMLERLSDMGYIAKFAVGLDECIELLEQYIAPIKAPTVWRPKLKEADQEEDSVF